MKGKNAFLFYKKRINSLQIRKKVIHSMHIQDLEIRTSQHNSNKKSKKHVDRGSGKMIYSSSTVRKGSEEVL